MAGVQEDRIVSGRLDREGSELGPLEEQHILGDTFPASLKLGTATYEANSTFCRMGVLLEGPGKERWQNLLPQLSFACRY